MGRDGAYGGWLCFLFSFPCVVCIWDHLAFHLAFFTIQHIPGPAFCIVNGVAMDLTVYILLYALAFARGEGFWSKEGGKAEAKWWLRAEVRVLVYAGWSKDWRY